PGLLRSYGLKKEAVNFTASACSGAGFRAKTDYLHLKSAQIPAKTAPTTITRQHGATNLLSAPYWCKTWPHQFCLGLKYLYFKQI
ncbi:MAG: hypothetical protein P8Y42_18445, partial [Exilibacterium sp.]